MQHLGSGVFGDVWRAVDQHLELEVAVKLLHQGTPFSVVATEAQALTALQSPHILEVLNADIYQDIPFLVTRVAQQGSVEDQLGDFGVTAGKAVRWARHSLVGVFVCHQRGLIHRDIKPGNIFVNDQDEALLGDFGVAARVGGDGLVTADGDHRVRPPEAYLSGQVDLTADIYGVGLAMYWMLTGSCPFDAQDVDDQVDLVLARAHPRIRDVAPHVPRVVAIRVERAMSAEPDVRYRSAQEMADDLARARLRGHMWRRRVGHPDHAKCWTGSRTNGTMPISVCVTSNGSDHHVEVRRESGAHTRIRDLCTDVKGDRSLAIHLRKSFDHFR